MSEAQVDILQELARFAAEFDSFFEAWLGDSEGAPRLREAVRYSALAPGKRIRPFVLWHACRAVGGEDGALEYAKIAGAAVECVHAFSLIHDDLPCMDDDDFRRGKPTNHKVFGEAMAVLAGDALVVRAFRILADGHLPPGLSQRLVAELAWAAGDDGMIGGQALDMEAEESPPDPALVEHIHGLKTAKLFEACGRMGALCALSHGPPSSSAAEPTVDQLGRFGRKLGLVFQITDDLLDHEGLIMVDSEGQGGTRKSRDAVKQTFVSVFGAAESRRRVHEAAEEAVELLQSWAGRAGPLRNLALWMSKRTH